MREGRRNKELHSHNKEWSRVNLQVSFGTYARFSARCGHDNQPAFFYLTNNASASRHSIEKENRLNYMYSPVPNIECGLHIGNKDMYVQHHRRC